MTLWSAEEVGRRNTYNLNTFGVKPVSVFNMLQDAVVLKTLPTYTIFFKSSKTTED